MPSYTSLDVPDYPQCTPQPLRIIHVGAGASGILFAHKAKRWLSNYTLTCYEKNPDIGGTWYENRYPGCACDIPAHTYVFPFEPNPDWSGYFSHSDEIKQYLERCADKWDVRKDFKLGHEVLNATWIDDQAKWQVVIRKGEKEGKSETFVDTCDVLINGSGILNKWKWPDVPGLSTFKGQIAHSAAWDPSIDWKGKKVAVIGTGSSSIQMVPQLAKTAEDLKVFIRNNMYIGPQLGTSIKTEKADPEAMDPAAAGVHTYTEKEKERFRNDPDFFLNYRTTIERAVVGGFRMFCRGSKLNVMAKKNMQADMAAKLGSNEELKERLIPDYSPGCRRLTPGEGYLESFSLPNVHAVFDNITEITPNGILTADGTEHHFDIIACATGFNVAYTPHLQVRGLNGLTMESHPNVYASVSIPGFPNYFLMNGPRGNWGQGCIMPSHECQSEYVLSICKRMQEDNIAALHPKKHLTDQLNRYMDAWHEKHSVWTEDCRSWYRRRPKAEGGDGRIYIWSGSLLHLMKFLKRPRFEHYEIRYRDEGNVFGFLGNGLTIGEEKYGMKVPVDYIRNEEGQEWEIE